MVLILERFANLFSTKNTFLFPLLFLSSSLPSIEPNFPTEYVGHSILVQTYHTYEYKQYLNGKMYLCVMY
jgi:hypothetical protein